MADRPSAEARGPARRSAGAAVVGAILVVVGLVFLVGQQLDIDLGDIGWPFYVIAPGVAILVLGLTQRNGSGLAVAGSMVTIVGLILLYQETFDHYESWAYAWALVAPGGSGMGMLLHGARSGDAGVMRAGFWQVITGLGLFVAGFVFFEGIIGISGRRLPIPQWVLPALVIGLGVLLLVRSVTDRRTPDEKRSRS